mgnify:CR=1 FL=1
MHASLIHARITGEQHRDVSAATLGTFRVQLEGAVKGAGVAEQGHLGNGYLGISRD